MPRLRREGRDAQIPAEKNAITASAPITQESRGRLPSSPGLPAITGSIKAAATYSPTWWAGLTSLFGMGRGGSPRL